MAQPKRVTPRLRKKKQRPKNKHLRLFDYYGTRCHRRRVLRLGDIPLLLSPCWFHVFPCPQLRSKFLTMSVPPSA